MSTASYGTGGMFWGTSAATPHTSAAAALVLGAYPSYSPDDVKAWLEGRATDLGAPGKDNQFGSGKLNLGPILDALPPFVSSVEPSGTLYSTSATITVSYSDAGSGVDPSSVSVLLDGSQLAGCNVTAASASCVVNGLSEGSHAISGSVADNAGNAMPFSGSFEVVCSQPALALGSPYPFWASYGDYFAGLLSVTFSYCNSGPNDSFNAELLGGVNTSGVQLATPTPAAIGDLAAGSCMDVTFKYLVPPGVGSFKSTLYIRADGPCGISYNYPGPYYSL